MASPTVAARTESVTTSDSTNHTASFTQTTGNLVIVVVTYNDATTLGTISDGFTDLRPGSNKTHILYKQALDGSEGGNVTFVAGTSVKCCMIAYNISGHSTVTVPEVSTIATGSDDLPDPGNLAPAGGAQDYLWLAICSIPGHEVTDNDSWFNAGPSGFGNLVQKSTGTAGTIASNCILGCADLAETASSKNPGTFNIDGTPANGWEAFTMAIYPVPTASSRSPGGGVAYSPAMMY